MSFAIPPLALITGSARRVGRATALELARAGYDTILHYRSSREEAERTAGEVRGLGRAAHLVAADLGDAAAVERLAEEAEGIGPVGLLVHNASVYEPTSLQDASAEVWDRIQAIHVRAPFLLSRRLGPSMKARGGGAIVLVGDAAVDMPYRGFVPYLVAKGSLHALTRCLAVELAPEVRVNAVAPGPVLPPEDAPAACVEGAVRRTRMGRGGRPEDVARAVCFLARDARYTTGEILRVDGGSHLGGAR